MQEIQQVANSPPGRDGIAPIQCVDVWVADEEIEPPEEERGEWLECPRQLEYFGWLEICCREEISENPHPRIH